MLNFSGGDEKAKLIALHYAHKLNNDFVIDLITNDLDIKNSEQAITLAVFFWTMLDISAKDEEENSIILGETGLQFWMERLMNIIGGYLQNNGYAAEWEQVCDEA